MAERQPPITHDQILSLAERIKAARAGQAGGGIPVRGSTGTDADWGATRGQARAPRGGGGLMSEPVDPMEKFTNWVNSGRLNPRGPQYDAILEASRRYKKSEAYKQTKTAYELQQHKLAAARQDAIADLAQRWDTLSADDKRAIPAKMRHEVEMFRTKIKSKQGMKQLQGEAAARGAAMASRMQALKERSKSESRGGPSGPPSLPSLDDRRAWEEAMENKYIERQRALEAEQAALIAAGATEVAKRPDYKGSGLGGRLKSWESYNAAKAAAQANYERQLAAQQALIDALKDAWREDLKRPPWRPSPPRGPGPEGPPYAPPPRPGPPIGHHGPPPRQPPPRPAPGPPQNEWL